MENTPNTMVLPPAPTYCSLLWLPKLDLSSCVATSIYTIRNNYLCLVLSIASTVFNVQRHNGRLWCAYLWINIITLKSFQLHETPNRTTLNNVWFILSNVLILVGLCHLGILSYRENTCYKQLFVSQIHRISVAPSIQDYWVCDPCDVSFLISWVSTSRMRPKICFLSFLVLIIDFLLR